MNIRPPGLYDAYCPSVSVGMNGAAQGRIASMNDAPYMQQGEGDGLVRPSWSISEAARRCGVSRATIGRHVAKGAFPNAMQTDKSWQIPLGDLLAAGFTPDRPAPPDPTPEVQQQAEQLRATDELAQRLRAAEDALERERDARTAAEARADRVEAVDAVKDRLIAQLERQVLMLEAGTTSSPSSQQPIAPAAPTPVPAQRRGLLGRTIGNLVDRGW